MIGRGKELSAAMPATPACNTRRRLIRLVVIVPSLTSSIGQLENHEGTKGTKRFNTDRGPSCLRGELSSQDAVERLDGVVGTGVGLGLAGGEQLVEPGDRRVHVGGRLVRPMEIG